MFSEDKTYEISPFKMVRYLIKHMAPLFWGVSIIPYYMGWVLATRKLYLMPSWDPGFVNFIVGMIAIGPMLGGGTLVFNDYWDREIDRTSRRKSDFPLPQQLIKPQTILRASIVLMVLAIIFSLFVSLIFIILVLICLTLSVCYSAPPLRFKTRPGIDVSTNAIGSGMLCSIAGWVVARPLDQYPIFWGILSIFSVSAIYIPTILADYESDQKNNVTTTAVRLGEKNTFYLGLTCITIGSIIFVIMGFTYYIIIPEFIYRTWPISVAMPILYWVILRKQTFKNVIRTIGTLTVLLTIGNVLLLLYYTGVWKIS